MCLNVKLKDNFKVEDQKCREDIKMMMLFSSLLLDFVSPHHVLLIFADFFLTSS